MREKIESELMIVGSLLGALVGVVVIYFFVWLIAYPHIGYYCKAGGTVASQKLDGTYWTGDSKYITTFKDGSQTYTGYASTGSYYCVDDAARFPW